MFSQDMNKILKTVRDDNPNFLVFIQRSLATEDDISIPVKDEIMYISLGKVSEYYRSLKKKYDIEETKYDSVSRLFLFRDSDHRNVLVHQFVSDEDVDAVKDLVSSRENKKEVPEIKIVIKEFDKELLRENEMLKQELAERDLPRMSREMESACEVPRGIGEEGELNSIRNIIASDGFLEQMSIFGRSLED